MREQAHMFWSRSSAVTSTDIMIRIQSDLTGSIYDSSRRRLRDARVHEAASVMTLHRRRYIVDVVNTRVLALRAFVDEASQKTASILHIVNEFQIF